MSSKKTLCVPNGIVVKDEASARMLLGLHVRYSLGVSHYARAIQRELSTASDWKTYLEGMMFENKVNKKGEEELKTKSNVAGHLKPAMLDPNGNPRGSRKPVEYHRERLVLLEAICKRPRCYGDPSLLGAPFSGETLVKVIQPGGGPHSTLRMILDAGLPEVLLDQPILLDGEPNWSTETTIVEAFADPAPEDESQKDKTARLQKAKVALKKCEATMQKLLMEVREFSEGDHILNTLQKDPRYGRIAKRLVGKDSLFGGYPDLKGSPVQIAAIGDAISILGSHQTRKRQNQEKREVRRKEANEAWIEGPFNVLSKYQEERRSKSGQAYAIGRKRDLRGWPKYREKWIKTKDRSPENLLEHVDSEQHGGDIHLLTWLAQPENHPLWDGREVEGVECQEEAYDYVSAFAQYNDLSRVRKGEFLTYPDPLLHPQWIPVKDTKLGGSATEQMPCTIRGLKGEPDPELTFLGHSFGLKLNKRWVNKDGIVYLRGPLDSKGARMDVPVIPGGAKVMIERAFLERAYKRLSREAKHYLHRPSDLGREPEKVAQEITEALLQEYRQSGMKATLALTVNWTPPASEQDGNVLGFDLGVRDVGGYTVYDKKLTRVLSEGVLRLGQGVYEASEYYAVSEALYQTLETQRLLGAKLRGRDVKTLDEKLESWTLNQEVLGLVGIEPVMLPSDPKESLETLDKVAVTLMRCFRHLYVERTHARSKDMDILERIKLLDTRKSLEVKFRRRPQMRYGRLIQDQSLKIDGPVLRRLKMKREGLMADYSKRVANAVVAKALETKTSTIVIEDLGKFKPQGDKKRWTNRMLARWAPQKILGLIEAAGSNYGIKVETRYAGYSSQFDAETGTPGVRLGVVTEAVLRSKWWRGSFEKNPERETLGVGDYYVEQGPGPYFLVQRDTGYVILDADVNASANMAKRYLKDYPLFAVTAQKLRDSDNWVILRGPRAGTLLKPEGKDDFLEASAPNSELPPTVGPKKTIMTDPTDGTTRWTKGVAFKARLRARALREVEKINRRAREVRTSGVSDPCNRHCA